jgi:tryptophan synthase alpha chain
LADGPINQAAAGRALAGGANLHGILELVAKLRARGLQIPILLLSYLNPLLAWGADFLSAAREAGVQGLVIPDLPPEEQDWFAKGNRELDLISFVALTTEPARRRRIAAAAKGFLYCVANTGVTGPRGELAPELESVLADLKPICPVPRVVGFGISNPAQAARVGKMAEGVIVGSALVELLNREGLDRAVEFVKEIKAALSRIEN